MTGTVASEALRADHRELESHLDGLHAALKHLSASRVDEIREHVRAIQRRAARHMEQEERVFYPALPSLAPDVLAQMERQHQEIRQIETYLQELLSCWPGAPSARDLGELYRLGIEFHDALQCHIVDEEEHLLKLADRSLSAHQQKQLLAQMQIVGSE